MSRDEARLIRAVERLARLGPAERRRAVERLTAPQKRALNEFWPAWAHEGQLEPRASAGAGAGGWRVWLLMAGRGFGKTRAGAEWVSRIAREDGSLRIALVGATLDDVRKVMIEGRSGLSAVAGTGEAAAWTPSTGRLVFASGAEAFVYSGENPEKLRGPEHHFAWCDEIAKWRYPDETWNNLQLGLRLGRRPRALATTTPRPIGLVRRLIGSAAVTRGRMADNLHLPDAFVAEMKEAYGGTRLGRQELDGELVEDVEGALWTREGIEKARVILPMEGRGTAAGGGGGGVPGSADSSRPLTPLHHPSGGSPPLIGEDFWRRVVIGVDPPASAAGTCGIVACGLGADRFGYVLGDHSASGLSPEGWARAAAYAAELHGADCVIAENNQGGEMVESVLRTADVALPVRPAHARFGKAKRAEPVAILFVKGKAKFAGAFPELEDELCGLTLGGGYEGPGRSPDRADAMVWALTELMLGKHKVPRIRML